MTFELFLTRPTRVSAGLPKVGLHVIQLLPELRQLLFLCINLCALVVDFLAVVLLIHCLRGVGVVLYRGLLQFPLKNIEFSLRVCDLLVLLGETLPPSFLAVGIFLLCRVPRLLGVRRLGCSYRRIGSAGCRPSSRRVLNFRLVWCRGFYVVVRIDSLRLLRILLLFFLARFSRRVRYWIARLLCSALILRVACEPSPTQHDARQRHFHPVVFPHLSQPSGAISRLLLPVNG